MVLKRFREVNVDEKAHTMPAAYALAAAPARLGRGWGNETINGDYRDPTLTPSVDGCNGLDFQQ